MLGKSRIAVFFEWFMIPKVRKVGSLKRRVRKQLFGREMQNGTPLWREARFQVKIYKRPHSRNHFWSSDLEKLHGAVARSTFSSQTVQSTSGAEQFLKWRSEKIAGRCGAKRICNSKCAKHLSFGAILEVPISKNCTPLWRQAHFQFKMLKNWRVRASFGRSDVQKWHAAVARSTFATQKRKAPQLLGAILEVPISKNCTPLWREAHFQFKMLKNWRVRASFGRSDVQKWHAAVARGAFARQKIQNTCIFAHFWTFRRGKGLRQKR